MKTTVEKEGEGKEEAKAEEPTTTITTTTITTTTTTTTVTTTTITTTTVATTTTITTTTVDDGLPECSPKTRPSEWPVWDKDGLNHPAFKCYVPRKGFGSWYNTKCFNSCASSVYSKHMAGMCMFFPSSFCKPCREAYDGTISMCVQECSDWKASKMKASLPGCGKSLHAALYQQHKELLQTSGAIDISEFWKDEDP